MKYDYKAIEKKWQDIWDAENTFAAKQDFSLPKYYALVEFPYPSGQGLILGPLLLAIGLALFTAWLKRPVIRLAEAAVSRTDKEAQTAVGTTEASDTKIQ